jgi:4-amino-4-deoxy-L-arabinose transferase-like glycosyltransferase
MVSAVGAFVVALALYLPTLMPTVGFWDTAEFQTVGPILGIAHPTGFPSYVLLTWAASIVLSPFGNTAFRIDLLSAILVAGAAGLVAATVQRLTGRTIPGIAAGLLLASAPITWWTAERADPHALHLFLSALLLLLLVAWAQRVRETDPGREGASDETADRLLLAASAVYAVALGNHALTVLLAPGIVLLLLAVHPQLFTRRPGFVLACAGVIAVLTVLLYTYIPIRASMNPPLDYAHPTTLARFAYLVLGLQFRGLLQNPLIGGPGAVFDIFASQMSAAVLVVAAAGFVAAVIGLTRLRGPGIAIAAMTATWFVIVTVFARAYNDGFPDRYYLVPLAMVALWAGVAASVAWDAGAAVLDRLGSRSVPLVVRAAAFVLAAVVVLTLPGQRAIAGQSEQSGATDASGAAWLDAAYAVLPHDAVVISWWSYSTTLWYGRWIEGRRPDVQIVDDRNLLDDGYENVQNAIAHFEALHRPIYLIRQPGDIPALEEQYHLVVHATIPGYSPLWEVVP